jgi:hypothetical protein
MFLFRKANFWLPYLVQNLDNANDFEPCLIQEISNRKYTGLTEGKLYRKYSATGLKLLNVLKEFSCAEYNISVREQGPDEKI